MVSHGQQWKFAVVREAARDAGVRTSSAPMDFLEHGAVAHIAEPPAYLGPLLRYIRARQISPAISF